MYVRRGLVRVRRHAAAADVTGFSIYLYELADGTLFNFFPGFLRRARTFVVVYINTRCRFNARCRSIMYDNFSSSVFSTRDGSSSSPLALNFEMAAWPDRVKSNRNYVASFVVLLPRRLSARSYKSYRIIFVSDSRRVGNKIYDAVIDVFFREIPLLL